MRWQAFYTPHTDDESIAMAGAIVRAREAGDNVVVVLVTDNRPSAYMSRVFGIDGLSEHRRTEWVRAMTVLGVNELRCWEIDETLAVTAPFTMQEQIEHRIEDLACEFPIRHHHTVWGLHDVNAMSGIGSLTHGLCANALTRVALRGLAPASLYGVYVYSVPDYMRYAPVIVPLSTTQFEQKQRALACYKQDGDSIGFGYRSVPELIDGAMADPREFVMVIK